LRGLAVLLMVLDHSLVAGGHPGSLLRWTVTRAALPLFCVVAGALMPARFRRPGRRWVAVCTSAVVASVIGPAIGIRQPDVLVLFAVLLPAAPWLWDRWRVTAACVAVIQPVIWPMGWGGYEPGTVLALLFVGAWLGPVQLLERVGRVQVLERGPLPAIGRAPLRWYVGHLSVLCLVLWVF
jgi:hypothetical protein